MKWNFKVVSLSLSFTHFHVPSTFSLAASASCSCFARERPKEIPDETAREFAAEEIKFLSIPPSHPAPTKRS